jgi:hypothetical protein
VYVMIIQVKRRESDKKTDKVDEQISHISQHTRHIEDVEQRTCCLRRVCKRPMKQD